LLGIPVEQINDDRLYRSLDILLPHKIELEKYLKERLGVLFNLEYDLLFTILLLHTSKAKANVITRQNMAILVITDRTVDRMHCTGGQPLGFTPGI